MSDETPVDPDSLSEKEKHIIEYCRPHTDFKWAADIVGIIIGCDFRDAEKELKNYGRD